MWCEQAGHEVHFVCYTGAEDLLQELPADLDVLFIGAFTQAAQLAYALSNLFRQRGAVTVLGGPHARCYPEDAQQLLRLRARLHRPAACCTRCCEDCAPAPADGPRTWPPPRQPAELPSLAERWKFVEATLAKAPTIKIVPMIGSLGCPYTCSFCIDSTVDYQPLGFDGAARGPRVPAHQDARTRSSAGTIPNFGVRFDDYMEAIEAAVPPGRMRHIAESSLSLLSEPHLKRLRQNGFQAILPGIESWYDLGNKSKTRHTGMDKVQQVAEHVNMILRYIPYVQTNFVLGLDGDDGAGAVRADQEVHRPGARRLPGLLAAVGVRPGGADEPGLPARRPGAARSRSTSSTTTTR